MFVLSFIIFYSMKRKMSKFVNKTDLVKNLKIWSSEHLKLRLSTYILTYYLLFYFVEQGDSDVRAVGSAR